MSELESTTNMIEKEIKAEKMNQNEILQNKLARKKKLIELKKLEIESESKKILAQKEEKIIQNILKDHVQNMEVLNQELRDEASKEIN